MSELDVIGALTGTDKSSSVSWAWDYLRHYEDLFAKWRHSPINLIEIGVAGGASLAAWEQYFDRATLVGIDINPEANRFGQGRVFIRIGSQDDAGFLHGVAAAFPPTIIIDDGSHIAHQMIAAFEALFPALLPGGIYVFEDMSFHFEDSPMPFMGARAHQGLAEQPIYDYLSKFFRARAACLAAPEKAWGFARYAYENIDSIVIAGGLIAVRKKAPRDISADITVFEQRLATSHDRETALFRYAEFLIRHDTHLDRAAALLQDLVAAQPHEDSHRNSLIHVLLRLNWLDDASVAASRQVTLSPANAAYWDRLSGIERMRHRPDLEIVAMQRLTELQPDLAVRHLRLSELHHQLGNLPAALIAARRAADLAPSDENLRLRIGYLESLET